MGHKIINAPCNEMPNSKSMQEVDRNNQSKLQTETEKSTTQSRASNNEKEALKTSHVYDASRKEESK